MNIFSRCVMKKDKMWKTELNFPPKMSTTGMIIRFGMIYSVPGHNRWANEIPIWTVISHWKTTGSSEVEGEEAAASFVEREQATH